MASVVFSPSLYGEDCFDRGLIIFSSMIYACDVLLELTVHENLIFLQIYLCVYVQVTYFL